MNGGECIHAKKEMIWIFLNIYLPYNTPVVVKKYPGYGVDVDIYVYSKRQKQPIFLKEIDTRSIDMTTFSAVGVVPRNKNFLQGVKKIPLNTFMELAARDGSATML